MKVYYEKGKPERVSGLGRNRHSCSRHTILNTGRLEELGDINVEIPGLFPQAGSQSEPDNNLQAKTIRVFSGKYDRTMYKDLERIFIPEVLQGNSPAIPYFKGSPQLTCPPHTCIQISISFLILLLVNKSRKQKGY